MGAGQDQDAFRKALEAADFASNRGDFPLARTTTPFKTSIIYVREVIKKGDIYTNKIVSLGLEDHGGVYAENCNYWLTFTPNGKYHTYRRPQRDGANLHFPLPTCYLRTQAGLCYYLS